MEANPEVRNWSRNPPVGVELVARPSWRSGTVRETLPKVQKWSETLPEVRN